MGNEKNPTPAPIHPITIDLNKWCEERNFQEGLKNFGFPPKSQRISKQLLVIVLFSAGFCLAGVIFGLLKYVHDKEAFNNVLKGLGFILTTSTLATTYLQFRASKHESTLDKYYDRLNYANTRLDKITDELKMYVYMEIDNLEYVIEKYKLGYIADDQAFRGLHAFIRHCIASEYKYDGPHSFIDLAEHAVNHSGYHHTTKLVVEKVLNLIKDRMPDRS